MRNRKLEHLIDDYLLDRLTQEERKKLEKHYFSSPCFFRKILERKEVISAVKYRGNILFQDLEDIDMETENSRHPDQEVDLSSSVEATKSRVKMEKGRKDGKKIVPPYK